MALLALPAAPVTAAEGRAQSGDRLEAARQRAAVFAEIREMINDPDPLMRLAYLEVVGQSGDATAVQLAARMALTSEDADLKSLAFRLLMQSIGTLNMSMGLPPEILADVEANRAAEQERERIDIERKWRAAWDVWRRNSGTVQLVFDDFDFTSGRFRVASGNFRGAVIDEEDYARGQISGTHMNFAVHVRSANSSSRASNHDCAFSIDFDDEGKLDGTMSCAGAAVYTVTATLLGS